MCYVNNNHTKIALLVDVMDVMDDGQAPAYKPMGAATENISAVVVLVASDYFVTHVHSQDVLSTHART